MNVTIRKATKEDIPTLLTINQSSFEANKDFDPYINMHWIHSDNAKEHFLETVTKDGCYAIVAEVAGAIVGFLFLSPKQFSYRIVKMIELDILCVLPSHQSEGIGKRLVESAKVWAKQSGYQTIYVSSYYKNERAFAFYKREGFTPIDISLELTL